MAQRSKEESSLPVHLNARLVDAVLELKEGVGRVEGKIDGLNQAVSDLHGRVAQSMTRDECASKHAGLFPPRHRPGSASTPKIPLSMLPHGRDDDADSWWKRAQVRVGVLTGLIVLLTTLGGGFYFMASEYNDSKLAKKKLMEQTDQLQSKVLRLINHVKQDNRDTRGDEPYGPPAPRRLRSTPNGQRQ